MTQSGAVCLKRILFYFPVIHTIEDLGGLGASVQKARITTSGRMAAHRAAASIAKLWDEIERVASQMHVTPGRVRVYQDGLPVCDHVAEIVADLAAAGSRNHRLLQKLGERGAVLMGTESPELLVEEYQLAGAMLSAGVPAGTREKGNSLRDILLENRDRFIASRINATLLPGETGILFIGMLHCVGVHLSKDIEIQYPVDVAGVRRT